MNSDGDPPPVNPALIERLRGNTKDYLKQYQTGSALFWSSQLVSLSSHAPADVLLHAESLFQDGQFQRAANLIETHQLDEKGGDLRAVYVRARANFKAREVEEALQVLDSRWAVVEEKEKESGTDKETTRLLSSLYLLRGQILESLDNRGLAADAFKSALRLDACCSEAFDALTQHHVLSADEEKTLLTSLALGERAKGKDDVDAEEAELLQFLYESRLKKYDKPADLVVPEKFEELSTSPDLCVQLAERQFYNCDYMECYKLTSQVVKVDPYHSECLPLHISCLVELNYANDLFKIAHRLVELYPEKACAWFGVGTYYFLVGEQELARRYLSKAVQLDRVFGPAWLAYGHSFALENEHDQAMAAYFKASQLMKGCHLPLLYIGMEYGLTNDAKLAEQFFKQALEIAPKDPFVLHELGVTSFQNREYKTAEQYYLKALRRVRALNGTVLSAKWESLLNNLGHTSRKLGKYSEALDYHQQALVLVPLSASTFSAIGYVYALKGDLVEAVEAFHKALGIRRDDTFSTTMLNNVVEHLLEEEEPFPGASKEECYFPELTDGASMSHCKDKTTSSIASQTLEMNETGNTTSKFDVEMADVSSD